MVSAWAAACLATSVSLFFLNPLAVKAGLLDRPGGRKMHAEPTPVSGGPALVLGSLLACIVLGRFSPELGRLALGAIILVLVGCCDDLHDIPWPLRVLGQIAAAAVIVSAPGLRVENLGALFGGAPVHLGWFSIPFSIIAVVGVVNAFNMSDGADGLAGGLGAAALVMFLAAALYSGNTRLAVDICILLGALVAFLAFNMRFPWQKRARVFLGNSGSAILGLTLAWASFRLTQTPAHPVAPVLAPYLMAPPLIDCLVLIARRLAQKRSPFSADRNHLHHLLLGLGWSTSQVVGVLSLVSLALGAFAAVWVRAHLPPVFLLGCFFGVGLGYYLTTLTGQRIAGWFTPGGAASARRDARISISPPPVSIWSQPPAPRRPVPSLATAEFGEPRLIWGALPDRGELEPAVAPGLGDGSRQADAERSRREPTMHANLQ